MISIDLVSCMGLLRSSHSLLKVVGMGDVEE